MITLDALSAYWIASHTTEVKQLNVTLSSMGRSGVTSHALHLNNHQVRGLEEKLKVTPSPLMGLLGGRSLSSAQSSPLPRVPWED